MFKVQGLLLRVWCLRLGMVVVGGASIQILRRLFYIFVELAVQLNGLRFPKKAAGSLG